MKKFILWPVVILVLAGGLYWLGVSQSRPQKKPIANPTGARPGTTNPDGANTTPKPDRVLAIVNDEPIRESDVTLRLPDGSFAMQQDLAREERLKRMVNAVSLRQYLTTENITVPESAIDARVNWLRANPPSAGCMCCSYRSLEEYMQANYLDMRELRAQIANDIGLQKHLDELWEKERPTGDVLAALLVTKRKEVAQRYVKASHIFFNTFQNPDFDMNPNKVRRELRIKANQAMKRLRAGEPFENVVTDMTEDNISRRQGGSLGCIPLDTFGPEFQTVVAKLGIGEYSEPVESPYGFHIVRRDMLEDKDVLELIREEFLDTRRAEVLNRIWMTRKVEYPGGENTQPAPTPVD